VRAGAALVVLASAGCLPALPTGAANAIDLRYRLAADAAVTARVTATRVYGWIGERSLAVPSRCKMVPTDSVAFAVRAERCGGIAAWYQGVARLLLEQASSARFAASIQLDGRLRWLDLPSACE
jgi:hypothetical protein